MMKPNDCIKFPSISRNILNLNKEAQYINWLDSKPANLKLEFIVTVEFHFLRRINVNSMFLGLCLWEYEQVDMFLVIQGVLRSSWIWVKENIGGSVNYDFIQNTPLSDSHTYCSGSSVFLSSVKESGSLDLQSGHLRFS